MFCTRCGIEQKDSDRFCPQCGAGSQAFPQAAEGPRPLLMLDKRNGKIGGVCAGFARYLGVDVTLIRVLWLLLVLGAGVGIVAYLVGWAVMPSDEGQYGGATGAQSL